MATVAEVTVICIDNSSYLYGGPILKAQLDAIKFYCEIKFKCNPRNLVGIFVMGTSGYGTKLLPTNDLQQILSCLEGVYCSFGGHKCDFEAALSSTSRGFFLSPQDMKRRLLMFVGSPINLHDRLVKPSGRILKRRRVALDIVNFFVMDTETSPVDCGLLYGEYHYARRELAELVATANDNGNSLIVDVDESSVRAMLSRFILSKNLRYLKKKEKKKGKENVNVKQELDLPHNERNNATAKYGEHSPFMTALKARENEKVMLEAA